MSERNVIVEGIKWVGYTDWDVRDFHGYSTERGSTYNAYLVQDGQTALIDTVKAPYAEKLLEHIQNECTFEDVRYVVVNHAEPDHSGSLPVVMKHLSHAEVVCNAKCKDALSRHYDTSNWNFKVVSEGETLELGRFTLQFFDTPMAHWPESMVTYVQEEKLLFSMDAFGQHFASSERFDDEADLDEVMLEARTYYANILMLYSKSIKKALDKLSTLDLEIVAPSHGVVWRSHFNEIVQLYRDWTNFKPQPKVLIFFDTMWGSTAEMAQAIYDGANIPGVQVKKYDIKASDITQIATETLDSACLAVGSSTLNKGVMPNIAKTLTYLKGLAPENKTAIAFGSYGWAKKSGQHVAQEYLREMKLDLLQEEPVQSKFAADEDMLVHCREIGLQLADIALKKRAEESA